jgi:hypothetical protein
MKHHQGWLPVCRGIHTLVWRALADEGVDVEMLSI